MSASIATPWETFDRHNHTVPIALLASILDRTADAWVLIEPVVPEPPKHKMFSKSPDAEYQALVTPYADSEPPEIMIYATFPKGGVFSSRGGPALPAWATLSDDDKESAMIDMSITVATADVVALAIAVIAGTSTTPFGDMWRTCIGDNHVGAYIR